MTECCEDRLTAVFSSFEKKEGELIPILQAVQEDFGYLPQPAMVEVAKFLHMPESRIYGVASFYAQFRFTPRGRTHIMACRGTACHVRGGRRILEEIERVLGIKEGETSPDLEYSLETIACIGACGLSPCMMVNKRVEGKMTPRKVSGLLQKVKGNDHGI